LAEASQDILEKRHKTMKADFKRPAGMFEILFSILRKSIFGDYFPRSCRKTLPPAVQRSLSNLSVNDLWNQFLQSTRKHHFHSWKSHLSRVERINYIFYNFFNYL